MSSLEKTAGFNHSIAWMAGRIRRWREEDLLLNVTFWYPVVLWGILLASWRLEDAHNILGIGEWTLIAGAGFETLAVVVVLAGLEAWFWKRKLRAALMMFTLLAS
ncbi:MAG TPA: hypothetical protein VMF06_05585, partial [Candidatus Limnocylindria bacterium]|nr:hypothetical protein [Candidatus Limnocylindria bacterium]